MDIQLTAEYLEATAPSAFLRGQFWFVPALQSVHILAVCLVLTGLAAVMVRAWALGGRTWTLPQWTAQVTPFLVFGLAALLGTGVLQVLAEPTRELPNAVFQFKLALLAVTLPFAVRLVRMAGDEQPREGAVRLLSAAVLLALIVLIVAGRWIAYA